MKWLLGVALFLYTGALFAQSLGDVARAQRNGENGPKAGHVITNADFATAPEEAPVLSSEKTAQAARQPVRQNRSQLENDREQSASRQRRINELSQQVQRLVNEVNDLEGQRTSLKASTYFGDSQRRERSVEIKSISTEVEAKRKELTIARTDLADESERAHQSSIIK